MQTIAIVDYGMGNVRSVQKALEYVAPSDNCILTSDPQVLRDSDRIVFPGQGAMGSCMSALEENSLVNEIKSSFKSKPFLGICLGFQLLCNTSTEGGLKKGLGLIEDDIIKMDFNFGKVPHVGFNNIKIIKHNKLLDGIKEDADFYFNHSYFLKNNNQNFVSSTCINNNDFVSSYCKDNIYGTQFHPEKSQSNGLIILKNFLNN